jgi:putative flavoprotein involved in K+ transport
MIIDGRIKLKSRTEIETLTKKGVKLTDGSELDADVVVFATGSVLPLF